MKKILLIPFLFFSAIVFSQTIVNRAGPANTVADPRLQATKNLYLPRYNDTTTANIAGANLTVNNLGIDSCGAKIYTRNPQAVWTRYCNPKRWVREGADASGGGSVVTIINDSTLVICDGNGVCDTIHFSTTVVNINNFEVINDSSVRICHIDTASGSVIRVCDTIVFNPALIADFFQNGTRRIIGTHIIEFGDDATVNQGLTGPAQLTHNTALDIRYNVLSIPQTTIYDYGVQFRKYPNIGFENGTGITSWLHENSSVNPNVVRLGVNFTDTAYRAGPPNLKGYMGKTHAGYLFGVNLTGNGSFGMNVDDVNSKWSEIFFDTKGTTNDAIIFLAKHPPNPIFQAPIASGTTLEPYSIMTLKDTGDVQVHHYPNTRNDGASGIAFYPDANGNIKVGPVSGGSSVTIQNDSTIRICSFGGICSTFVTHTGHKIQLVFVLDSTHLRVCDTALTTCDTLLIPKTGFDRGFFDPNQVSLANTIHATNGHNFTVGNGNFTSPTGTVDNFNFGNSSQILANGVRNYTFINNNTVSGSENFVPGRNMVVAGNTNFAAATDGTIKSSANYSAVFNDANDNWGTASMTIGFGNDNYVINGFTGGDDNVNGYIATDGLGTPNLYTSSFMYGIQNRGIGGGNFIGGSYLFPNNATGNITMFGTGINVANRMTTTVANSFNVGFNKTTPDFEITSSKIRIDAARFEQHRTNTTTAAANDLTLPITGNLDSISGNTQINAITTTDWQSGSVVRLFFGGTPLVKNNTTGGAGTAPIRLSGGVDFTAGAGDILTLVYEGTYWRESARSIAASTVAVNANEGLIDSSGYIQLGGPTSAHATVQVDRFIDWGGSQFVNSFNSIVSNGLQVTSTSTAGNLGSSRVLANFQSSGANTNNIVTSIALQAFTLNTGTSSTNKGLNAAAAGATTNYGVQASAGGNGVVSQLSIGVNASTVGSATQNIAGQFSSTSSNASGTNFGILAQAAKGSVNNIAAQFITDSASTSAINRNIIQLYGTQTTGSPPHTSDGVSSSIDWFMTSTGGSADTSNRILSRWTTANSATRTSQLEVYSINNAATNEIASFYGSGVVGIGIFSSYTATRLNVVDNGLAGATGVDITSTSTGAASNSQKLVSISLSGANSNANQTTWGLIVSNAHSGTNNLNRGIQADVTNGNASSVGVRASADNGFAMVATGSGSATGISASASGAGNGGSFSSSTGLAIQGAITPSSTNTIAQIMQLQRASSGTAASGIGGYIGFDIQTDNGTLRNAAKYSTKWSGVVDASRTSVSILSGVNSGTTDDYLVMGDSVTLSESSATTFASTTIPQSRIGGGEVIVTITANDGADYQSRTQRFIWTAVNKGGTTTITLGTVEEVVAVSGGTLTSTITAVDAGGGVINFKANATSSLSQTVLRASYTVIKNF